MSQTYINGAATTKADGPSGAIDLTGANWARAWSPSGGNTIPPTDTSDAGVTTWELDESHPSSNGWNVWKPVGDVFVGGTNYQISAPTGPDANPSVSMVAYNTTEALTKGTPSGSSNAGPLTTYQDGAATPDADNGITLSFLSLSPASGSTSLHGVDSPFTAAAGASVGDNAGDHFSAFIAHHIQTTAGADNPTWSWTGGAAVLLLNIPYAPTGGAPATLETLDGPASGFVGHQSADFTVDGDGDISAVTTTPTTDGTGAFIPSSLMGAGTFKYVSLTAETCNINCSNDGGLTPPDDIAFTSTVGTPSGGGRLVNGGLVGA